MSLFKRGIETISTIHRHFKGNVIGKIDVLFRKSGKMYAGEIKWTIPRNDFWLAMKVVGYCAYYNWQNETWGGNDVAHPAILIPMSHIKLEHKIVANKLKISIFGIIKVKDGYKLELVNK